MFRLALRLMFLAVLTFVAGCMGISSNQVSVPEQRKAAVRSGLDLLTQLEHATTLTLDNTTLRTAIGNRLGIDSGNANFGASNTVLGVQIAVGAEDPRGPKIPSSLNNGIRIAYAYCDVSLGLAKLPPIFANTPVTAPPTASAFNTFIKQAEGYFSPEAMGDANRALLATALIEASPGRPTREAWATACAAVAAGPNADVL